MKKNIVKLMDVNTIDFCSKEEVGLSIVTIMEITKGQSDHDRHMQFKKVLNIYGKKNYHIYFPQELKDLEKQLTQAITENNQTEQFAILDQMCSRIMTMVYIFFSQMVCLIVLVIIHLNHDLVIGNGSVICNTVQEEALAHFSNCIVKFLKSFYDDQETIFKDCYKGWKKGDGDSFGNSLFNQLIDNYYRVIGWNKVEDYILCGKGKNLGKVLIRNTPLSLERIETIYKAYFQYRINDKLTKKLFIPYVLEAINEKKQKFEFNHISDCFLIFNALTAENTENEKIVIDTGDETVKRIYNILNEK